MSLSKTTSFVKDIRGGIATKLQLVTPSISRGLVDVITGYQHEVAMSRFQTSLQNTVAPVATPTTPNNAGVKDEKSITLGDAMWYNEFNPLRVFEDDYAQFVAQGRLTDAELSTLIRNAMEKTVLESIGNDLEQLIWNGDTAGANAYLNRFDGFLKIIDADGDVNDVTPAGAVTPANIFTILDDMITATRDAVLELGTVRIIMSHKDKYKLFEAQRTLDFKGIEYTAEGVPRYAGIPIISCGIPESRILMTTTDNLKGAVWTSQDYQSLKIDRLQSNSELFFVKALYKFGVNYMWGEDITNYKPA